MLNIPYLSSAAFSENNWKFTLIAKITCCNAIFYFGYSIATRETACELAVNCRNFKYLFNLKIVSFISTLCTFARWIYLIEKKITYFVWSAVGPLVYVLNFAVILLYFVSLIVGIPWINNEFYLIKLTYKIITHK